MVLAYALGSIVVFLLCVWRPSNAAWLIILFIVFRDPRLGYFGLKPLELFFIPMLAGWGLRHLAERKRFVFFDMSITGLLLLFLGSGVLSMSQSSYTGRSLEELYRYAFILLMMFTLANVVHTLGEIRVMSAAFLTAGFVSLVIGLAGFVAALVSAQENLFVKRAGRGELTGLRFRLTGFDRDPNFYATFCLIIFFLAMAYLAFKEDASIKAKVVLICVGVLAFTSIAVTFSRGAWAGLLAGVAIVACRFVGEKGKKRGWVAVAVLPLLTVVALYSLLLLFNPNMLGKVEQAFLGRLTVKGLLSQSGRRGLWLAGINMFMTRPLIGVGIGAFKPFSMQYASTPLRFGAQEAHNMYLDVLATTGLMGFLPWFLLLWLTTVVGWRNTLVFRLTSSEGAFALGLFAAFVALLVQGGSVGMQTVRGFWLTIALVHVLARVARADQR